jgi:hypothetical protein
MWALFQELKIIECEAKFEKCKRLWLVLVQQYLSFILNKFKDSSYFLKYFYFKNK